MVINIYSCDLCEAKTKSLSGDRPEGWSEIRIYLYHESEMNKNMHVCSKCYPKKDAKKDTENVNYVSDALDTVFKKMWNK